MENRLLQLEEFHNILRGYKISSPAAKVLSQTELALMVAPTSSGRNTLIRELVKTGDYHYLVSDTTRHPRINDGRLEKNGEEYWFRTEDQVLADLKAGIFLEAAIIHEQQVSGISMREVETSIKQKKIAVTDVEIAGVDTIIEAKPDTIVFFVVPPDFKEWQRRIKHRGAMTPAEHRRRMVSAMQEFGHALEHKYYTFIVNDVIDSALEQIHSKAVQGFEDPAKQARGRRIVEHLYLETQKHLV